MTDRPELRLDSPLLERAHAVADEAHAGNTRKGSDTPEITHPIGVAWIVQSHGFDETLVAAALLHDVVEDTILTREELEDQFPVAVCAIVHDLTEKSYEGTRRQTWRMRKETKIQRLRQAPVDSLVVCAADRLHNVRDLIQMTRDKGLDGWAPFSRGPRETLWFEHSIASILQERLAHAIAREHLQALGELESLIDALDG